MDIRLTPLHLRRYKDIILLFIKYGRSDLVKSAGLEEALRHETAITEVVPRAEELASDLERMGPTFIKLGQILSTRADILPVEYIRALARLQDKIEPFPYDQVDAIVASELGIRIPLAFDHFDKTPIAAASLGQVHKACLKDGRTVAVKVQRPGIRAQIVEDLEILMQIAEFLDRTPLSERFEFHKMVEEFRRTLMRELDYRQEARNMKLLAGNLAGFSLVVVPLPIDEYSSSRMLTMEYISGRKITELTPLARTEIDGTALAEELFRAYLSQIIVDGFFHADPHPGNLFLTNDHRIALLDVGMVGQISPELQDRLLHLIRAIGEGRHEDVAALAIKIGERRPKFDQDGFRNHIAVMITDLNMQHLDIGTAIMEFVRFSGDSGLRLPPELTLLGKTLLNLDIVARTLDPNFDPNTSIRSNLARIIRSKILKSASPSTIFGNILEMKEFFTRLPTVLGTSLEKLAKNELEMKIDAIDEKYLMNGLQKIANRITLGLILAALIVGAAMLFNVQTEFRILGYPGIAMLFFLAAAGGGIALMLDILFYDEKPSKK
ncbi:ABC1 kinase family protein [Desulfomonile tiedjei]|uniref:Putative unusual protein kinase n=1 Tax=Desulfomonile tiedjei (strain ATCC 49306 / DSM 6799 / DCB-1) TaxID=706587 RepID=I4CAZ3_DESTA|nr:AarF/UbiB family protein [Desulfomonile tiedjei]AFM26734.1 putative unusual protein kinase [Desulfomonile tiedjei DSM 6799]